MELDYWMSTFKSLTTMSTLLTGFAFGSLHGAAESDTEVLNIVYLATAACSMGFGMLCISTASLSMMFGREKALLGGGEAMESFDTAIDILKAKSTECFYYFVV
jgi:hypothetical protein